MYCIYKGNSILGEKITTYIIGIIWLLVTMFFLLVLITNFDWICLIFCQIPATMLLWSSYNIYRITRFAVNYKIVFFDDYLEVRKKDEIITIEYNKIRSMNWKRSYSTMSSGVWFYLEIVCELAKPIYVQHPRPFEEKLDVKEFPLKKIKNVNFKNKYNIFLNSKSIVEKRELCNKI